MSDGAPYDARAIANFFLDLACERDVGLTQMQVLKLVYFASGWYLVSHSTPLIKQDFQAWEYGPVVKVVRDSFKDFGKAVITSRAEKFDLFTGELTPVTPVEDEFDQRFMKSIFEAYHIYDGWELSAITHEEGSPWHDIWNSKEPIGRLGLKIDNDSIRQYFSKIAALRTN